MKDRLTRHYAISREIGSFPLLEENVCLVDENDSIPPLCEHKSIAEAVFNRPVLNAQSQGVNSDKRLVAEIGNALYC